MFLAQLVFGFRPQCLKPVVTGLFWRVYEEREVGGGGGVVG